MRNHLRDTIEAARLRERMAVPLVLADGWTICPGCSQSSTGSYAGHQCCTRCHRTVT